MAVTMEEVLTKLAPIEPDYEDAARLGPDAVPHLERLAEGPDTLIAAKAISLAGLIKTGRSVQLLLKASQSATPEIRVQAAWAVGNLSPEAAQRILPILLDDADSGVRSVSLKASRKLFPRGSMPPALEQKIAAMSKDDPEPFVRQASIQLLSH
jgi:HEAT repeat protein